MQTVRTQNVAKRRFRGGQGSSMLMNQIVLLFDSVIEAMSC